MNKRTRILIADDHAIVRYGLNSLFQTQKDMLVVGQARNGLEAIEIAARQNPDVAIVDLVMPKMDGAETSARLKEANPDIKILILTSFGNHEGLRRAIDAGADGAILKTTEDETLIPTVRRLMSGEKVISNDIKHELEAQPEIPQLTPRQLEILNGLVRGLTNVDIGKMLHTSPFFVRDQLKIIFARLGAANRTEAARIALRLHLIEE